MRRLTAQQAAERDDSIGLLRLRNCAGGGGNLPRSGHPHDIHILSLNAAPVQAVERITVPHTIYAWKQDPQQRDLALAAQTRNREALQSAFHRGLAALGYKRDVEGNGSFLLGWWDDLHDK